MFAKANRPRRIVKRTLGFQTMENRQVMAGDSFEFVQSPQPVFGPTVAAQVFSSATNDTMASAINIGTVAQSVSRTGSVGGTDPVDFYRFRVASSGTSTIQLNGLSRDVDIYVLDSAGNQLARGANGGTAAENVSVFLNIGRDYFLKVVPFGSGAASNYQFQINVPYNDTMATATNLGTVSSSLIQNGSVGGADAADYFRFSVSATRPTRVQLSGLTRDVDVYVLDSLGNTIARGTQSGTTSEDFLVNLNAGRTYYLRVVPFGSSAVVSNYQLRLSLR